MKTFFYVYTLFACQALTAQTASNVFFINDGSSYMQSRKITIKELDKTQTLTQRVIGMNDSTALVVNYAEDPNTSVVWNELSGHIVNCANPQLSWEQIQRVNKASQSAYFMQKAENSFIGFPINELIVWTRSKNKLGYFSAKYNFEIDLNQSKEGEPFIVNKGSREDTQVMAIGEAPNACGMNYILQETIDDASASQIYFSSILGVTSITSVAKNSSLELIDDLTVEAHTEKICASNIFLPRDQKGNLYLLDMKLPKTESISLLTKPEPTIKTIVVPTNQAVYQSPEFHKVEKGQNIKTIANSYSGLTVAKIMELNGLKDSNIKIGQVLRLRSGIEQAPKVTNTEITALSTSSPIKTIAAPAIAAKPQVLSAVSAPNAYLVKENETLFDIADKHGVSVNDLILWNNLESLEIKPGTPLAITDVKKVTLEKKEEANVVAALAPKNPLPVAAKAIAASVAPSAATAKPCKHVIKPNETLLSLAATYNVSDADLILWNNLFNEPEPGNEIWVCDPKNATSTTLPKTPLPSPVATSPSPSPKVTATASNSNTYKVNEKETLYGIARKFNVTSVELMQWNNLTTPSLTPGQELIVKQPQTTTTTVKQPAKNTPVPVAATAPKPNAKTPNTKHKVQTKESLYAIAKKYNTTVEKIIKDNNIVDNKIALGQELIIK
jgi:LysM repeat protein